MSNFFTVMKVTDICSCIENVWKNRLQIMNSDSWGVAFEVEVGSRDVPFLTLRIFDGCNKHFFSKYEMLLHKNKELK